MSEKIELRNFALVVSAAIIIVFGIVIPWMGDHGFILWPFIAGGLLAATGLRAPLYLRRVYRAWMELGRILHYFVTPAILSLVFIFVFLPCAVFMKIVRRDSMNRSFDSDCRSYRIKSAPLPRNHFERPF